MKCIITLTQLAMEINLCEDLCYYALHFKRAFSYFFFLSNYLWLFQWFISHSPVILLAFQMLEIQECKIH